MKIILAGATGFIGQALCSKLLDRHELVVLTRSPQQYPSRPPRIKYIAWDLFRVGGAWEREIDGADAVINLTGEPVVGKRWSAEQKKQLLNSRVLSVRALHRAVKKANQCPKILINASAVGFYGDRGDETLDESSASGTGFLPELCREWEEAVQHCSDEMHMRTVLLRIGIVLDQGGGALGRMLLPFKLGLGGPLGSGKQWMSWIHREDVVGLLLFALENDQVRGVLNATAPEPVTMAEFSRSLGRALRRPAFFRVPAGALKLLLGEMAGLMLGGQRVLPKRALEQGGAFRFPKLEDALADILSEKKQ